MQFKNDLKNKYDQEENKVNQEIDILKNQELQKTKSQTPAIPMFEASTPDLKDNMVKMGLRDYQRQI